MLISDELVDSRHTLAHAVVMPQERPDTIQLSRRRKGKITLVSFRLSRLQQLADEAYGVFFTLAELMPHAGDLEVWGILNGFDEDHPRN